MAAKITDVNSLLAAGINPKTGLPVRLGSELGDPKPYLKDDFKRALRVMDEQECVNRYAWYNLPSGLDGQLIERILYYKGQGMFFFMPADETFYFLPYALDGTIDVYGRYTGVTPLPFNGKADGDEAWILGLTRKPIYDVMSELDPKAIEERCVLLSDYSKQISQTVLPRQTLNEPILDAMSEAFPLARTGLVAHSGVSGMRVPDEDAQANVKAASRSMQRAAMSGDTMIPIVGNIDFQELSTGGMSKVEEPLLYMQSLDNFRKSTIGVSEGGLFEKRRQMLQSEMDVNRASTGLVYQDGLTLRQKFCDQVNSIWPWLMIWCEPSETQSLVDVNGDGGFYDTQDQSGVPGEQPETTEEGE